MAYDDRDYRGDSYGHLSGSGGDTFQRMLAILNYSFSIGTYLATRVKVHIFFVILLGLYLLRDGDPLFTLRWSGLLFISVLLHEFGHVLACRRVGGEADEILMWPLGGLAFCRAPHRPMAEFITVACGPLVTAAIALGCYFGLVAGFGQTAGVTLNPFQLLEVWRENVHWGWPGVVQDLFVVNYILLLFNMLLVFYPFDGGRLVQVAVWSRTDYLTSMRAAIPIGMVGAGLIALVGLAVNQAILVVIAIFGFFACYQQSQRLKYMSESGELEEDWKTGGEAFEGTRHRKSWLQRRRERKLQERIRRDAEQARRLEEELDRILAKVSRSGMDSLTSAERRILQTATKRERGEL